MHLTRLQLEQFRNYAHLDLALPPRGLLIHGAPTLRRRYLDITIAQIDTHYIRQLNVYNRIVEQRNSLLRQIVQEGRNPDDRGVEQELSFWNEELIRLGSYVVARRDGIIRPLAGPGPRRQPAAGRRGPRA